MSETAELQRQVYDLTQRLTRMEEAGPDPRIAAAHETAQQALSEASSTKEIRTIVARLDTEMKAAQARLPRVKSLPAEDPEVPDPASASSQENLPANQEQTPNGSTSDPPPPPPPAKRKRRF